MEPTYSQLYIHFIFAVNGRHSFIPQEHKEELQKFMTALVQNRNSKLIAINCMPDHTHIYAGITPEVVIQDFVKEIKVESNRFINSKQWLKKKFSWQTGYGAFSYSRSSLDNMAKYILNQEEYHRTKNFEIEYKGILKEFEIDYDPKYLFEFYN